MKLIILGGGFAGLKLASKLENKNGWDILLIDRYNYHQFQPLFNQVATAGLDASNISFPLRKVFHKAHNVRIRIAEVVEIKYEDKCVLTSMGSFAFDQLVIATGADTNFFGNSRVEQYSLPMKSTVQALRIRHHLIRGLVGLPQVAPVAIQQAKHLYKNLERQKNGLPMIPFVYTDKGTMATIGRHKAVGDLTQLRLHFKGFTAWIAWLILHLFQIVGVKNRFFVLLNWIYYYVTFDQSLRLWFHEFSAPEEVISHNRSTKVEPLSVGETTTSQKK